MELKIKQFIGISNNKLNISKYRVFSGILKRLLCIMSKVSMYKNHLPTYTSNSGVVHTKFT